MKARELIGYLMGLILFVILVPLIMWKLSEEVHPNAARLICLGVFAFKSNEKKSALNRTLVKHTKNTAEKQAS